VRARMGQAQDGLTLVRAGLALALEHNLAGAAAEIYQRLADAPEHAGDYAGAKDTYDTAGKLARWGGGGRRAPRRFFLRLVRAAKPPEPGAKPNASWRAKPSKPPS